MRIANGCNWMARLLQQLGLCPTPQPIAWIDDDVIYPPPYQCDGVKMFGFFFKGDHEKIKQYVNRFLNVPRNNVMHYYPLTDLVMVTFQSIDHITAGPPYDKRGYLSDIEIAFWIPTFGMKKILGKWVIDPFHPAFFTPYMFVDNFIAIVGGREIYGAPKQMCAATMPTDHTDTSTPFTADVLALQPFNPQTHGHMQRLMTIELTNPDQVQRTVPENPWQTIGHAFNDVKDALAHELDPHLKMAQLDLPEQLFNLHIPLVFMKQFREIQNNTNACYQAVTECQAGVQNLRGWKLDGTYQLTLNHLDSLPIADEIGVDSQPSLLNFWLELDMTLPFGNVVWSASDVRA